MQYPTYGTGQGSPFGSLLGPQFQQPLYRPSGLNVRYSGYNEPVNPYAQWGHPQYGQTKFTRTGGVTQDPNWSPGMQASERFMPGDNGDARAISFRQTYGILDQARFENAQRQFQSEQALFAAGQAQTQGFDRAIAEAQRYGAAGYREAEDLEQRLLGETKASLAGSGLYGSSMQVQASQFALERGMRARLETDRTVSQMYQQLFVGRAGAQAQTYQELSDHYERARATNEASLMSEFNQRMGIAGGNAGQRGSGDDGSDAQAWGQIASGLMTMIMFSGW